MPNEYARNSNSDSKQLRRAGLGAKASYRIAVSMLPEARSRANRGYYGEAGR